MQKVIKEYLTSHDAFTMQLATVCDNMPWICTVYFVADDDMNIFWLSWPSRRHSQEINKNKNVAAAVVIKEAMPVIGLQIEGAAEIVNDQKVVKDIMDRYIHKYNEGHKLYENFINNKNQHYMYKLKPSLFVLMDELNYNERGMIEWRP